MEGAIMTRSDLIPPSPSEADYDASQDTAGEGDALDASEPLALFSTWLGLAREHEPNDPNAMALATADAAGLPDVRMVLLKDFDARGFVFYTNLESAKGEQLAANPQAALCFHWKSLRRQVRVRGAVSPEAEADAYFKTRARDARIGAWASKQSRPMEGRFALQKAVAAQAARFGVSEVERPPFWSGFRLAPERMEFWRDRPFRLHDRLAFVRNSGDNAEWIKERLYP